MDNFLKDRYLLSNYGASNHMVACNYSLTSLYFDSCITIYMGYDSQVSSKGKGTIHLEHGSFKNFLYVPSLDSNLLSVYQITHIGLPIRVVFNPDDVEISEIASGKLIVVGKGNHSAKTYEFSNFVSDSKPSSLLTYGKEVSQMLHERFGHLNYKYL